MGMVSVLLMILLSVFISIQVISRYALNINIPGLFDLSIYSLILFTFLSAAYTLREGQHICIDLFTAHLADGSKIGFTIVTRILSLLFVLVLGFFSWKWAYRSFLSGVMTISEVPIPKGILVLGLTFGSFLLLLQILRSMVFLFIDLKSLPDWKQPILFMTLLIIGLMVGLGIMIYINPITGVCFIALMLLMFGMPVFLALGFVGSLGLYLLMGESALSQLPFIAYKSVESFPLTCLPLFIIAGIIMEKGKIVDDVFLFFRSLGSRSASGPLLSTILVGGFFCAVSGSSVATTSLIAAVSLPVLIAHGYRKSISSGVVAGATIGTVIPPSIGYVLYGVIAEESIGQLFIAGIVPAAMIFGFYFLYIIVLSKINQRLLFEKGWVMEPKPSHPVQLKEKQKTFKKALCGLFAPVFVLGGIYLGIFTPTEAAAMMVLYAVVITVLIIKTISFRQLFDFFLVGAKISSMILMIVVAARIFGALTSQLGIASDLVNFIKTEQISPAITLLFISTALIVLGMFLDASSIMVITLPVFHPVITAAGFNSIWFGVFFIIILEIGLLTPPVGLNLFVIKGLSNFNMGTIIKGSFPFVLIMLMSLFILVILPELATWLPALML
jgi:C4-dicarboxylate transporter DctM subunit